MFVATSPCVRELTVSNEFTAHHYTVLIRFV